MNTTIRTAVVAALAGVALAGCASNKDPYAARPDTIAQRDYPQVEVTADLAEWVAVNTPVVERDEILKVTVPVRLLSDHGEFSRVKYRFTFLDAKGVPLRVQPDEQYMKLEPRNQVFMKANATDSSAVDWRLYIRPNR
jgi:uncharacterized protein YcfL